MYEAVNMIQRSVVESSVVKIHDLKEQFSHLVIQKTSDRAKYALDIFDQLERQLSDRE